LYSYLLRPLAWTCRFPWVTAPWDLGARAFPNGFELPEGYSMLEPSVGMLVAVPWTWLGVAAGIAFGVRAWARPGAANGDPTPLPRYERPSPAAWSAAVAGILVVVPALAFLGLYVSTMRYLADLRVGFVLVGTLGAWWLLSQVWPRPMPAVLALACALLAGSTI